MGRIRIRKADTLFSKYVKIRDSYKCQRCFKQYQEGDRGLHCAHFHSRRHENTRFDPSNAASLCFSCHQFVDSHPYEKIDFFTEKLGQDQADKLRLRANIFKKKDDKLTELALKGLLEETL